MESTCSQDIAATQLGPYKRPHDNTAAIKDQASFILSPMRTKTSSLTVLRKKRYTLDTESIPRSDQAESTPFGQQSAKSRKSREPCRQATKVTGPGQQAQCQCQALHKCTCSVPNGFSCVASGERSSQPFTNRSEVARAGIRCQRRSILVCTADRLGGRPLHSAVSLRQGCGPLHPRRKAARAHSQRLWLVKLVLLQSGAPAIKLQGLPHSVCGI